MFSFLVKLEVKSINISSKDITEDWHKIKMERSKRSGQYI